MIAAVEAAYRFGFPQDAEAVLIIEIDGARVGLDRQAERSSPSAASAARATCALRPTRRSARCCGRAASAPSARSGGWPRTTAPRTASCRAPRCRRSCAPSVPSPTKQRLRVANVFHAGDGNIHPILLYDERDPGQVERVLAAGRRILEACVALGGSLTGEHGIGVEKMELLPLLFDEADLELMGRVRRVFDPELRCNPHKIFPAESAGVAARAPRTAGGAVSAALSASRDFLGAVAPLSGRCSAPTGVGDGVRSAAIRRRRHRAHVGAAAGDAQRRRSEALAFCAAHDLCRRPGGPRPAPRAWALPPARLDAVISTSRMDRVVEHAADDLTITVEAGATLAAVNASARALRGNGCRSIPRCRPRRPSAGFSPPTSPAPAARPSARRANGFSACARRSPTARSSRAADGW